MTERMDDERIAELRAIRYTRRPQCVAELLDALVAERAEVERHCQDLRHAAGELLVPLPEPGTDVARLLRANRLMRDELASLRYRHKEANDVCGTMIDDRDECRALLVLLRDGGGTVEGMRFTWEVSDE